MALEGKGETRILSPSPGTSVSWTGAVSVNGLSGKSPLRKGKMLRGEKGDEK